VSHRVSFFLYIIYMSKMIDESQIPEPPVGSHLLSPRTGFNHHGIYIGNGRVIHYSGMARTLTHKDLVRLPGLIRYGCVVKTSIKRFCDGHGFRVIEHPHAKFTGEAVVERAKKRLYERSYYLYSNNCEHFVNWCIDDTFKSPAVTRILIGFAVFGFLVHAFGISKLTRRMPMWARILLNGLSASIGSFILTHFTIDALQPAEGIRGRERRNRYFGRIGARCGLALAPLFAIMGIRKDSKLSESLFPFFLPVIGGLGTYGVFRLKDTLDRDELRKLRRRKQEIAVMEAVEAAEAEGFSEPSENNPQ